ncbi:MAG: ribosomal-protein-alanine N-acetyltransferase [Bacteroidia bacterium]|jgi:ribosomal-protein-alanine N-acetyltransferase
MAIHKSVFDSFPVLKTKRLTLRKITMLDAESILQMRANQRVSQFIAREVMSDLEDAKSLVSKTEQAFTSKNGIGWAGELKGDKSLIGSCGFNRIDYDNLRAEIGGELSIDFWGKHIAVEAVQAIVAFGFSEMNLHAIEAFLSPDNRSAIYLLEALGFKKEAHFRDRIFFQEKFSDAAVYTLLKPAFLLMHKNPNRF